MHPDITYALMAERTGEFRREAREARALRRIRPGRRPSLRMPWTRTTSTS